MTKCLLKALKAVNLDNHVELFRSLGYDSAGALAHFHKEHFKKLNLSSEELLRVHALLDVLKEATREGKICPHYSKSNKPTTTTTIRAKSVEPPVHHNHENSPLIRTNTFQFKKQSNENLKPKRSSSSIGQRLSTSNKTHANGFILQKPSSNNHDQQFFGPKSLSNRPAVQHVKVKSYNYGVPKTKQQRNTSHHVRYQHETNLNHPSIFIQSSNHSNDIISYAKPAEIYVYARKRPLLSNETNFRDIISVPDNKHMIMSETKSNLDCTPLLKKSEFQFDQVFSSDASNKQVFENTVLPFLSSNHHRHNLTYICFGQTGSGKSHTIFGSRNTDGLIIYCVQLLLQEVNLQNKLLCSFYEIYNNQVYDLINTGKRLFVREDGEHHVNIVGLTEIILKNLDTLRSIIYDGLAKRHHGKSAFNSNSSRSHAIFQIILKNTSNQNDYFRMVFIDLAGSERAIDAQNNQKQTRREGAQINSSLLALKECIRSMDMTHSHAPFRQSKLTHILRDSLVGTKTRTCLMANVLPANDCCQCSLNTLQYASRIRDISIKHRHRSMSINNIQRNYIDNDEQQIETIIREKPQRTFKPATASTPVHRLMTSVDHRTYMSTNQQTDVDNHKRISTTTKTPDIDWRIVDNDIPISGSGDNVRIKSVLSSTREFLLNTNTNNQNQNGTSFYLTRYEQPRKKHLNQEENTSSYFPPPQTDIKKSSTNDIQTSSQPWISIPISSTRRLSDSSIEPSTSSRIIPIQILDDNQYSSATGTESLGTKITKLATGTNPHQTKTKIENLNLNKQYDTGATTTTITTTDTEQGLYSDRQATHRDQTGFFSNRDDPLYENNFKSTNLTTITQRTSPTATPKNSSHNYKSDPISTSSKKTFSSPNKTHRNRHIKPSSSSSSSSSSLAGVNSNKKPHYSSSKQQQHHHRIVPYHNSDSDDIKYQSNKSSSTRNESSQTQTNIQIMKNEQEQTDDQFLLEQFSDETSKNFLQAPLDQIKHFYDQSTTSLSPPKDYGIRVSDQLNTLRTLLETRLMEQDNLNHHSIKDLSLLKSSPETFTKEFLQSYKYKNHSTEFISDLDDDQPQINLKDKYESDALSTSSSSSVTDEIHQEKLHSTPTVSSTTSTIKSNYSTKIDTRDASRVLSNSGNDIYPRKTSISNSDIIESISDSERISDANSGSQNRYTSASSESSSINHSRTQTPIRNSPFDVTTGFHEHLIDSGKGSSLLTGTSFDVLMNSLKSMREKDLDYLIHSSDDSLIRVTD